MPTPTAHTPKNDFVCPKHMLKLTCFEDLLRYWVKLNSHIPMYILGVSGKVVSRIVLLTYCQLHPYEQPLIKFKAIYNNFQLREWNGNCRPQCHYCFMKPWSGVIFTFVNPNWSFFSRESKKYFSRSPAQIPRCLKTYNSQPHCVQTSEIFNREVSVLGE